MADSSLIPEKPPRKRGPGRPFVKGQSGNPAGRPSLPPDLKERAQAYSLDALDALHGIVMDADKPAAARVSAAVAIMDRGHGKPVTPVIAAEVGLGELLSAMMREAEDKGELPSGPTIDHKEIEHG